MYEPMHDRALRLPKDTAFCPSFEALEKHFQRSAVA